MTTNQTIDGVPRGLLENCASYMEGSASGTVNLWHKELRALLDAPAKCDKCFGAGNIMIHTVCGATHKACECSKAADQSQGEPVAWALLNGNDQVRDLTARWDVAKHWDGFVQPLCASQPTPVSVVLPEREMYCQYLRGIIPSNRLEVEAYKEGWNACLDELKRLNPSL